VVDPVLSTLTLVFNNSDPDVVAHIPVGEPIFDHWLVDWDPTRDGYTFAGWHDDELLTSQYTFGNMPETHLTLYAKWTQL
jgi:uncharacterized repeat protein (TIGR02543 family)